MELFINKDKVASKLQVAIGFDASTFNTYIREAVLFDFKPLVRENFFMDLQKNKAQENFAKLLAGGTYNYEGDEYSFEGLETVLCYYTHSRFVLSSGAVSSSFGMVVKTSPNSQPLSLEERKNYHYRKQSEASLLWDDCKKFIERNLEIFPSYNEKEYCSSNESRPYKTTVIQ